MIEAWRRRIATLRDNLGGDSASSERYRRIAATTAASVVARVVSISVGLVTVRVVIPYLGREKYGLWMTLSSVMLWASVADLGLGRGLANFLADAEGRRRPEEGQSLVSTSLWTLAGVGGLVLAATGVAVLGGWVPMGALGVPEDLRQEANEALMVLGAFFALSLPAAVGGTVLTATQRGYVLQLLSVPGSIAGLAAVWYVAAHGGGLAAMVAAGSLSTAFPNLAAFIYIRQRQRPYSPTLSGFRFETLRKMWNLSLSALVFQVGVILVNQSQMVILSGSLGLDSAGKYALVMRIYGLLAQFLFFLDAPFIPAFRHAIASGDAAWTLRALGRFVKIKMAASLAAALALVVFGDMAAAFLSKGEVTLDQATWWAAGSLLVVSMWASAFSSVLVAMDQIWNQVGLVMANGAVTVALTLWLVPRYGVLGALLGLAGFTLVVNSWALPWLVSLRTRELARASTARA